MIGCDQCLVSPATRAPHTVVVRTRRLLGSVAVSVLALAASGPAAARDGADEVRARSVCGGGTSSELRLERDDGELEVRFELDHDRAGVPWRVALVHERRVVWRVDARRTRSNGDLEVRRTLRDLPGTDTVSVRAVGPRGLVCRATATLR